MLPNDIVTIAWICYIVGLLQPKFSKFTTVLCYHFYVSSTKTIITTMTATFRLVEVIAALLYE